MTNYNEILLENYDYVLPTELIAQEPLQQRDQSRLMIINRVTDAIEHRYFFELPLILQQGDVLVMNNTRVFPARLFAYKENTGGKVELLLLEEQAPSSEGQERWKAMVKPGKNALPGARLHLNNYLKAEVEKSTEEGNRILRFYSDKPLKDWLSQIGNIPLPPYIKEKLNDEENYQTIYAKYEGSIAAPTAGFHFTQRLLQNLDQAGIERVYLTLHVGSGTFLPVKTQDIREHRMHYEYFKISSEAAYRINRAREEKRRIIAVGTTSCRVLETMACKDGTVRSGESKTGLFIYPGYNFKIIDGMLTNFHLPRSTLLMLVAAFIGREKILSAYQEAVEKNYRFYSFGDATLLI